ncbi:MAG: heavy-metal-associated domain-containing protein [Nitrososphaera sp.]
MKARFKVAGLYCTSCKGVIEKSLKDNVAVREIYIDLVTDSVIVDYDETVTNPEQLKSELEKSGYHFTRLANWLPAPCRQPLPGKAV